MMVGREIALAYPPRAEKVGAPVLQVEHLEAPGFFRDASFSVHAGEIVGIGGIPGSGQEDIIRALFGLVPAAGEMRIDGSRCGSGPGDAIKAGVVYLPADRRREGCSCPIRSPTTSRCRTSAVDVSRHPRQRPSAGRRRSADRGARRPHTRPAAARRPPVRRKPAEGRFRPVAPLRPRSVYSRSRPRASTSARSSRYTG